MPDEGNNILGAMQNFAERSESVPHSNNNYQQQPSSPSCLILSPSNPLRTFAISFLTHWVYSTVIIVTICAFTISSTYCNFWCDGTGDTDSDLLDSKQSMRTELSVLKWARRILFVVILLEILVKSVARGLLVGELSYLRIKWDWLDVISLALIFVSMIIPWKAVDSLAASLVLFKLIPIHTGSINAFISLCSCAKNLIPVLVYWIIIVWIYGIVIFTLFVKYQQDIFEDNTVSKTNGSASDSVENENITQRSHVAAFVDGDYLTLSTSKTSKNFSFGLSVECLPTNLRSLSGSIIQVWMMLTLGFSQSDLISTISRGNTSSLNKLESLCQYEIYTLSIVETLVIITGTLPMITMTFGALYNFFQQESAGTNKLSLQHDDNETEQESQSSYQYRHQRRRLGSGISGRSNNSHSQNDFDEGSSCLSSSFFKQLANILCDCDYYFCCLANLQRRLNPCATRLLTSKRFKAYVLLVMSVDFLCMIMLLWFRTRDGPIDFPPTWLITRCVQICFVLYTVEAVFKWFAVSSDEYWLNIWSAFDLTVVCAYWIGYAVMHVWAHMSFYSQFCGILMIRMLKVVPYCESLQHSLNVMMSSLLGKLHHLFVILICSCSTALLKYAICKAETEVQRSSQPSMTDSSSDTFYFHFSTVAKNFSHLILYFLCSAVITCIFIQTVEVLKSPQIRQHVNASVSFLLNDSYSEELANMHCQLPRPGLNEAASPNISIMSFPGGVSPMKYRFASTPIESNNPAFTQETQSMLSPSSDVLSPLLTIPNTNGLNGHIIQPPFDDNCVVSSEPNIELENNDRVKQDSFSHMLFRSKEFVLDLASSGVTILSSINIALESSETGNMSWNTLYPGQSFWLEVVFIVCIGAHIIYRTRLHRFSRETFMQISCVFDLLIVLAAAVEIFSSGMKWLPLESVKVFVNCAKVLSACRGLILFSRIPWLQSVGSSVCKVFWNVADYLTGFGYLWLIFLICSVEAQKIIVSTTKNHTNWGTSTYAFDNNRSENNDTTKTDRVDELFIPHSSLVVLMILLFLSTFGVFLGFLIHKIGSWNEIIKKYAYASPASRKDSLLSSGKFVAYHATTTFQTHKPTEGICVPVLYFVTNHLNFDIIVMLVILFDGLVITLEHLSTSERALILRRHYPAYILFIYLLEQMSKLGGNGIDYFKNKWNIFDALVILVSIADFIISLALQNEHLPLLILNIRFLRILRIFQFQPFVQRTQLIQKFMSSTSNACVILRNFGLFYFSLFFIAIIFRLRCTQFIPFEHDLLLIAAPFPVFSAQTIFEVIGNLNLVNFTLKDAFSFCCLVLFSMIRISVIFSTWIVLLAILCLLLLIPDQKETLRGTELSEIYRFPKRHQGVINESVDSDDKYSYLMPCISPETIDIETPSTSGTNCRATNNNGNNNDSISTEEPEAAQNNVQNSSLYKTTTITSSEEINGCKVFFVEAMITTV